MPQRAFRMQKADRAVAAGFRQGLERLKNVSAGNHFSLSVGLAENTGALHFPGRGRRAPVQAPPKQEHKETRLTRAERARAQLLGRAILAPGAAAGAALAFGGQAGLMTAAFALMWLPPAGAELSAVALAVVLALSGVPLDASGALAAWQVGIRLVSSQCRPARALGGMTAASLWLLAGSRMDALTYLAALVPASAAVCLLPGARTEAERAYDDTECSRRMQRRTGARLSALADALSDMSRGHATGLDPPREDELLLSLRTRLCEGCVRYERCWNGRAGEGLRLLCELITRSANGTLPKAVLPDMLRRCLRADLIPMRLYPELEHFSKMRSAQAARMDGVRRAQLTIDTAAQLLQEMARAQTDAGAETGLQAVQTALRCRGIFGASVTPSPDGWVISRRDGWTREAIARACRACAGALGGRYKCTSCAGRTLCIAEAPGLVARTGWHGVSAEGSRSGDSICAGPLDDRRQLALISDGMGVGDGAADVSRRAVQLIRKFLRAGIPPERAALLANQLMISQGSGESFATLDLCVIDLVKMEAVFVKMAACDSYLMREHDCSVISGGRLPMGILTEATPQVTRCALLPGDVIVMGTDGAMEGFDPDTAQRCLIRHRHTDEAHLAAAMLRAGEDRRRHADDRTLAVIRALRPEDEPRRAAAGI